MIEERSNEHQVERDALAWSTVWLGGKPLVEPLIRARGNSREIVETSLERVQALKHAAWGNNLAPGRAIAGIGNNVATARTRRAE